MGIRQLKWFHTLLLAVSLAVGMAGSAWGFEIAITVSPNILNIQSAGRVVTVHTDIAYGEVYAHSVFLNGVYVESTKADNQGNFVAKFDMGAIKSLAGLVYWRLNTLTLVGETVYGEAFSGSDRVLVIDRIPRGGTR